METGREVAGGGGRVEVVDDDGKDDDDDDGDADAKEVLRKPRSIASISPPELAICSRVSNPSVVGSERLLHSSIPVIK